MNEGINCLMNIGGNSHIKRAELLFTKKEIEKRESRTITSLSGVWFAPKKEFFFFLEWGGGVWGEAGCICFESYDIQYLCIIYLLIQA
jgi:hypothetical protein